GPVPDQPRCVNQKLGEAVWLQRLVRARPGPPARLRDGDRGGSEGVLTTNPRYALRRSRRSSLSRTARPRSGAVWSYSSRYSTASASPHARPRRPITFAAVCTSRGRLALSVRLPSHQLQNDGTYFGSSRPDGSKLQKTPAFVPVFSSVPSPVL